MRKNRLITLISSLAMAVAGIGAIAASASELKKADCVSAATEQIAGTNVYIEDQTGKGWTDIGRDPSLHMWDINFTSGSGYSKLSDISSNAFGSYLAVNSDTINVGMSWCSGNHRQYYVIIPWYIESFKGCFFVNKDNNDRYLYYNGSSDAYQISCSRGTAYNYYCYGKDGYDPWNDDGALRTGIDQNTSSNWTYSETTYTVSLSATTGGSVSSSVTGAYYKDVIATFTATPNSGYEFDKWNNDATLANPLTRKITEDLTLVANFKAETYNVTLNKNGGSGGDNSVTATYNAAMPTLALSSLPTRTGYSFDGYYDNATSGERYYNADGTSAKAWDKASASTLYAHWAPNPKTPYTVNHYWQNTDLSTYTLHETDNMSGPTASQTEATAHTYTGFTAQSFSQTTIAPDGSTVIIINYNRTAYTMSYDLGIKPQGDVPTPSTMYYGCTPNECGVILPDLSGTWDGYTFVGWKYTGQGQDIEITQTTPYSTASNITITAQWEAIKHSVTYVANGGEGTVPTQADVAETGTFTVAAGTGLSNEHYTFGGWSDGTNVYQAGETYIMGTSNVTLTAVWTPITHTVTYNLNGGIGTAPTQADVAETAKFTLADNTGFSKEHYTFAGWSDGSTTYAAGAEYTMGTSNVTLTAQWTPVNYNVTLAVNNANYGSISGYTNPISVPYGTVITLDTTNVENDTLVINGNRYVATPVSGDAQYSYSFTGWTGVPTGGVVVGTTSITAGFAQTVNKYTITFLKDDGETVVSTQSVDYDTMPDVPEGPAKPSDSTYSYTFAGWEDENGNAPVKVTGNATYTATYEAKLLPSVEANRFIAWFNEKMAVCDKDGHTDEEALATAWNSLWSKSSDVYTISYKYIGETYTLSNDAKLILSGAKGNPEGSNVEKFAFAYDYICGKYNLENFLGRNIKLIGGARKLNSLSDVPTSTWIIAAVAIAGIAAVGVFFIYKKRKEN